MEPAKQLDLVPAADVTGLSGGILTVIARAAADPNTDVDKLERLLAMQERVMAREAEQGFNASLKAAQEEIRPIIKNKINPDTKSKYADLVAVSDAIDPVFRKHGFSQSFGTADCPLPAHYRVTCLLSHDDGHSREYQADVPIDNTGPKGSQNKTMTHGFGSALSYGRRYLKLLMADVATKDDDGRGAGRAPIDDAQYAMIVRLIETSGADTKRFLAKYRIETVNDLPAAKFQDAVDSLKSFAARNQGPAR